MRGTRGLSALVMLLPLAAACGGGSPQSSQRSAPPLVITKETPPSNKEAPPQPASGPTGNPPPASATGGRTAIACRIPVSNGQPGSGGFVTMPAGGFTTDPASNVALDWTGAPAPASNARLGMGPPQRPPTFGLSYDRAAAMWLPVPVQWVAPDGKSYAYPDTLGGGVRVAKVADGSVTTLGAGKFWNLLDVEGEGVYAVQADFNGPAGSGLWLLAPGKDPSQVVQSGFWNWATSGYAYGYDAPSVPQGAPHPLLRINLRTGNVLTWYQRGDRIQWVAGFDSDGSPVVTLQPPPYSQSVETAVIPRPDHSVPLLNAQQGAQAPVIRDAHGFWIEAGGLYLNSIGYGAEKVSDVNGQLGGGCA